MKAGGYTCCNKDTDHQGNHCTEQWNNQLLPDSQHVFMTQISDKSVVTTSEQTGGDVYWTCKVKCMWGSEKPVISV